MFTFEEFLSRYEKYSDDEIIATFYKVEGFSPEAQKAFKAVVKKRGGQEYFVTLANEKNKIDSELRRIANEAAYLYRSGESRISTKAKQ